MSGFDENPFGEPTINDPFSDPAIRRAVSSTPVGRGLEDYNPFAEQNAPGVGQQVRGAANPPAYGEVGTTQQPATLQPTNQEPPPPAYTRTPQQTVNAAIGSTISPPSNQPRAEEQWKAETRDPSYYPKRNNWPPLPEQCCFQPCFYQDIDVEIHTDFQRIVRQLYTLWMFHCGVMLLNVVGGFILMFFHRGIETFSLGIIYLILFTPFSFLCWYRPAYKAFKNDSSVNFMVFFFIFFFQLIVTSIQAIGLPGSGTCGLIMALSTFDASSPLSIIAGVFLLAIALGFVALAICDLLMITQIHRIYRRSDASVSKAQQEFASTFLRNEHVQNAASNVAATAIRQQMASAAQPRY